MAKKLTQKMLVISSMDKATLAGEWSTLIGSPAPALPVTLLVRALTYRLQEKTLGGVSASALRDLRRRVEGGNTGLAEVSTDLTPGATLVRTWKGRTLSVVMQEDGQFEMDGRLYSSLSHIAREVTGTPWSGPRFFGLVRRGKR